MIVALKAREAIGLKLAQDVTCVDREFKGAVKRRGEVVREDDVELLERCGHSVVYVYVGDERVEGFIHEDEAVDMLAKLISGPNLLVEHVEESKAYIRAAKTGLLVVNSEGLKRVNASGLYIVATRRTGSFLRERELAGVVELVPYMISEQAYRDLVESIRTHVPILTFHPARRLKIGIVVTGTEVVTGKVRDLASPVVVEKIKEYGCEPGEILYARDDELEIADGILSVLEDHDAVIVTGGMSVDPTDYTPHAIRRVADEVVIYGLPIKPTTMTMLAYRGEKAIIGISAGVIYYNDENALDILLPWVAAGVKPPRDYLISLGEGGLLSSFLKRVKR